MIIRTGIVALTVLVAAGCAFPLGGQGGSVSAAPSTSASTSAPAPTPTPTPTTLSNGLPAALSNGWTPVEDFAAVTEKAINTVNQEFPDANVKGQAYSNDGDAAGVLLLMVADERIDSDTVLSIFSTETDETQPGTYTSCGIKDDEADDQRVGCVTQTDPSVMALYFSSGGKDFTQKSLGEFVAEYQANL